VFELLSWGPDGVQPWGVDVSVYAALVRNRAAAIPGVQVCMTVGGPNATTGKRVQLTSEGSDSQGTPVRSRFGASVVGHA
jgi:hypothetical protein